MSISWPVLGLVKEISTPDLRDTEIYVYRVADGKLIGSRWGMSDAEVDWVREF